eukprot:1409634-Rhodomonas_salina.1
MERGQEEVQGDKARAARELEEKTREVEEKTRELEEKSREVGEKQREVGESLGLMLEMKSRLEKGE